MDAPSEEVTVGSAVKARFGATEHGAVGTRWFDGVVTRDNGDGSFAIEYADGDVEERVERKYIKPSCGGADSSAAAAAEADQPARPKSSSSQGSATGDSSDGAAAGQEGRGRRMLKPTTVMVGGFAVKRQNMYDMEEGEGSVWDRELGEGASDPALFGCKLPKQGGAEAVPLDESLGQPSQVGPMGLGKTLQTIAFLAHLKFDLGVGGPHLVVAPLSVLSSWMTELKRFCPGLASVKLHSSDPEERKRLMATISANPEAYDVVVTTFEMAKSPNVHTQLASRAWWRYLIVDEGHALKNDASQVSQALRSFHAAHKLLLTGTPLQNNLHELWALLHFLYEQEFPTSTAFDSAFNLNGKVGSVDNERLAAASRLLQPLMLRRTKGEALLRDLESEHAEHAAGTGTDWKKLSSLLMQLRKCCNHPFLFPNVEPSGDEAYSTQLVDGSGKFQILQRLLAKLFAAGHRVVLFSQFTSTLDLLEDFLTHEGYKYGRLDGSTNRVQRTVDINAFNMPGSSRFVFLMSTRAGGLGINCQTADTCILFDSDWNPQVDLQAMARVHRIGQTKTVHLYRLVSPGTVEERIVQRAEKKLYLDQMVNRGSSSQAEAMEQVSTSEMLSMLKFGAQCCFASSEPPTDDQLDAIIDRSRKEGDRLGGAMTGVQRSADSFDASASELNLRQLGGVTYGQGSEHAGPAAVRDLEAVLGSANGGSGDINAEWEALQAGKKREKKGRFETQWVKGVGEVAGRDFLHEERCLVCWKGPLGGGKRAKVCKEAKGGKEASSSKDAGGGSQRKLGLHGELRGCDLCPAAFHLRCIGMAEEDATAWGIWACPHHSCSTCGRKAAAAGGLLFRCAVCPQAFCEDHLPAEALIMGENERFQALGAAHPKQGCYLLCKTACVKKSDKLGFGCGEASASAAAILGATGVDTTSSSGGKRKAAAQPAYKRDERTAWEKLQPGATKALAYLLRQPAAKLGATATAGFRARAQDANNLTTVELLHDLLFDSELTAGAKSKADRLAGLAPLVERLASWGGADREKGQAEARDEAAETYMRLVTTLEGLRTYQLQALAALIGAQRLSSQKGGEGALPSLRLTPVGVGLQPKFLASVMALFLSTPHEYALILDQRAGASDKSSTELRASGDPGFLVNTIGSAPLYSRGKKMVVRGGQLVQPKPPPLPSQPQYRPIVQPKPPAASSSSAADQVERMAVGLPPGWSVKVSKSTGKAYYVSPSNQATVFEGTLY
ncbi:hypothetical protein EMIHUDRAFT_201303 [Emiliania huxleyi CCMP1516]|uniref:Uncharacterized protein n=2 Tax=Emiliania huxleyi TaxID=2903 RepID=A0A0D3KMH2_EMIH1|nr:hypothetical protein EMIHUDRAFT_201303 [Emiliania huxleyi CCMP1516]EOD36957.1 hypothetical protein EMIHUDRAFT_201303 [Emiliania huxleyi CCMP1516]|eukprot:XP_005789386.1 hypothetical protein EMIHUDRAFT_201303 [Emiliania huxleyi CCMP1516]